MESRYKWIYGVGFFFPKKKKANYQKVKKEKKNETGKYGTTTTTTLFFEYRSWIVCPENSWKTSRGGATQENE